MAFNEGAWAKDLLTRMDFPVTRENMTAVLAWHYAEGGHTQNNADWNPLNTSKTWPGAESINSHGVKAYDDYEEGMAATIATLKLPYYDHIRKALREGDSAKAVASAVVASPWGTTSLIYATIGRARDEIKEHPNWLKPPRDSNDDRPKPHRNPDRPRDPHRGTPSRHEDVLVYPGELRGMSSLIVDKNAAVNRADEVGREVWAALDFGTVVDPNAALPAAALPGVDRGRLLEAAREVGRSLDDNLGLPFVRTQLQGSSRRIDRFLQRLEEIEAEAQGYRPRSRAEALRMLKSLKGKLDPVGYAAMEVLLLGGLKSGRPPGHRPTTSNRPRPDKPKHRGPGGPGSGQDAGRREQKIKEMIKTAESQIGYREGANNYTKYGVWYGVPGSPNAPWCAMFVSWVFAKSGNRLPPLQDPKGFDYTNDAITELRQKGELHRKPKVGDVFIYNGHTGIVTDVNPDGTFDTIEGNAGPNTDRVVRGTRDPDDGRGYVFWSPIK